MRYWPRSAAEGRAARSLPHLETEPQLSINDFWSSILGNQGITQKFEHITELLTALVGKNTKDKMKNTDSKIIDIANCKTCIK